MPSQQFDTDVLVIGGGPAGLAAALAVRLKGFRVTITDSASPPIDKACGEGILPHGVAALRALGFQIDFAGVARFRGIRFVEAVRPRSSRSKWHSPAIARSECGVRCCIAP